MTTRKRWVVGIGIFVIVVALVVTSSMSVESFRKKQHQDAQLNPMSTAIRDFPLPAGSTISTPETRAINPYSVTTGWTTSVDIDKACPLWNNAFRNWLQPGDPQPDGEYAMGQSCSLIGKRGPYKATLVVAVFGTDSPQATLTLTK